MTDRPKSAEEWREMPWDVKRIWDDDLLVERIRAIQRDAMEAMRSACLKLPLSTELDYVEASDIASEIRAIDIAELLRGRP